MKMRAVDLDMVYLEGEREREREREGDKGRDRERGVKRGRARINQSVETLHGVCRITPYNN